MTSTEFSMIVQRICQYLEHFSATDPKVIAACKTGEDFEQRVYSATKATLSSLGIPANVLYTPGSHVFPDIIVEFDACQRYGIEVKSSSSSTSKNWKINGNSVLGSTKENVLDTYIVFGKTAIGNQGFRFKRYEDAIANVAVTHSPRYAIDMDISPNDTFFAKSGLTYKQISESDDPIGQITAYFRSQGQKAWWLSESTPAAVRMFSDLSDKEQAELIGYCFAHFPEIFSRSPKKFYRCATWLVTERSVVAPSLRDSFTAGGRTDISLYGATYKNVPQIFNNLRIYRKHIINAIENASIDELREDWNYPVVLDDSLHSRVTAWVSVTAEKFSSKSINNYDRVRMLSDLIMA